MSDVRELNEWARTVVVPRNPEMTSAVRIRAASTLRSIREASASGNMGQAAEWLDALEDYRDVIERIVEQSQGGAALLPLRDADAAELNVITARMPRFNASEDAAASRVIARAARRDDAQNRPAASMGGGLVWLVVGAGALWMLSRRRG